MTENSSGNAPQPAAASRVDKAIVLCLGAAGTVALFYLAWYRLPVLLWSWVTQSAKRGQFLTLH